MVNRVRVDDGSAEEAAFVVCALLTDPLMFDDNEVGECCECHRPVQFRPHAPKTPPRICLECAMPMLEQAAKDDEADIMVTEKTMNEITEYAASIEETKH